MRSNDKKLKILKKYANYFAELDGVFAKGKKWLRDERKRERYNDIVT